ncbi:MAG TPA: acyl-CoA carboxylase subunit epsilon [Jatrophihabitantaceae bacterium]|jgi:hypothetical protein
MSEGPVLRVVRGEPTAEELAVVTAVVSASGGAADEPVARIRGRWNDPAHMMRQPLHPGPGGWRAAVR